MADKSERKALFPGTFDPVTLGHVDLIERAAALFDHLTVAVAGHHDKRHLLTVEERVALDLTGVVWNPHMPLAFVNGLTVGKGDRVGDAEIIHIGKESISVRYPDKTERTLALTPDDE